MASDQDRLWTFGVWMLLTGMLLTGLLWGTDLWVFSAAIAGSGLAFMFNAHKKRDP